jgi:dTDP-4-dehydrorhamnose 3,5-epimerase-like enzyme
MTLAERILLIERRLLADERGWFLKTITGMESHLPARTGEVYFTSAKPGKAKGGHYHVKATEWFTLIQGECLVRLVDVNTNERVNLQLSFVRPQTLMVPPGVAHMFENMSQDDFILSAYSDELFDPADTIPYTFN